MVGRMHHTSMPPRAKKNCLSVSFEHQQLIPQFLRTITRKDEHNCNTIQCQHCTQDISVCSFERQLLIPPLFRNNHVSNLTRPPWAPRLPSCEVPVHIRDAFCRFDDRRRPYGDPALLLGRRGRFETVVVCSVASWSSTSMSCTLPLCRPASFWSATCSRRGQCSKLPPRLAGRWCQHPCDESALLRIIQTPLRFLLSTNLSSTVFGQKAFV